MGSKRQTTGETLQKRQTTGETLQTTNERKTNDKRTINKHWCKTSIRGECTEGFCLYTAAKKKKKGGERNKNNEQEEEKARAATWLITFSMLRIPPPAMFTPAEATAKITAINAIRNEKK